MDEADAAHCVVKTLERGAHIHVVMKLAQPDL